MRFGVSCSPITVGEYLVTDGARDSNSMHDPQHSDRKTRWKKVLITTNKTTTDLFRGETRVSTSGWYNEHFFYIDYSSLSSSYMGIIPSTILSLNSLPLNPIYEPGEPIFRPRTNLDGTIISNVVKYGPEIGTCNKEVI